MHEGNEYAVNKRRKTESLVRSASQASMDAKKLFKKKKTVEMIEIVERCGGGGEEGLNSRNLRKKKEIRSNTISSNYCHVKHVKVKKVPL